MEQLNLFDIVEDDNEFYNSKENQYYLKHCKGHLLNDIHKEMFEKFPETYNDYIIRMHDILKKKVPVENVNLLIRKNAITSIRSKDSARYFFYMTPKQSGPCYSYSMLPDELRKMF